MNPFVNASILAP